MQSSVQLGSKQYGVIGLTIATAIIHLIVGVLNLPNGGALFVLNGIGYVVLLAALYFLPQLAGRRSQVLWAFIGYTAVTFILYFVFNGTDWSPIGIVDKIIELVLIVLLWMER